MFARSWRIVAAAAFAAGCLGWGREGRPHALLVIAGLDSNDNCNGDCLSKKRGRTREKKRGNLKMGLFFMQSYFVIVFWLFIFQCRLIDSLSRSSQLLDGPLLQDFFSVIQIWWSSYYSSSSSWLFIGYLLQDFSSSHPNLVISFLFGNYSVRVNCCK